MQCRKVLKKANENSIQARRKMRAERRLKILEMRDEGKEWAAIRRILGVSTTTIRNDRIALGLHYTQNKGVNNDSGQISKTRSTT